MIMEDNWIYEKSIDNKARFLLWEKGNKNLICIGINPSTATSDELDNTLRTVKRFALDNWYDWWLMLNIYPQRATNPDNMDKILNITYHKENIKHISKILRDNSCDVWAAWGTLIEKRNYLKSNLLDIYDICGENIQWYTIWNKSKKWHPHHPLYLKKTLKLEAFNIKEYIHNL